MKKQRIGLIRHCKEGCQLISEKPKEIHAKALFAWFLFVGCFILLSAQAVNAQDHFPEAEATSDYVSIPIHPVIELDYKTKAQIYHLRAEEVLKYAYLLSSKNYSPSEAVFGQIQDNKPWWGIYGLCYYGDGEKSIEGPSEESRFLMNPFLLVALDREFAMRIRGMPFNAPYPEPENLAWKKDRTFSRVTYVLTNYWKEAEGYYPNEHVRTFLLEAYNARDLGFDYLYVDERQSANIISHSANKDALQIPFFIHLGTSCKYPGGCNNGSPVAADFRVSVTEAPAKIYIKLWRKKPFSKMLKGDMVCLIDIR